MKTDRQKKKLWRLCEMKKKKDGERKEQERNDDGKMIEKRKR